MDEIFDRSTTPDSDRSIADTSKDFIPGWGMDADPDNDPTYPMKRGNGADHRGLNYEKAPQQPIDIEVLRSIERPGITRVFGTSTPPQGLSGAVRRYAFRYSEATTAHWMALLLADRINVVEGLVEDFKSGHVPNYFKERGWYGEWKYNQKQVIRNLTIAAGVVAFAIVLRSRKRSTRHH